MCEQETEIDPNNDHNDHNLHALRQKLNIKQSECDIPSISIPQHDITLHDIPQHDIVLILAQSGSGKNSLLRKLYNNPDTKFFPMISYSLIDIMKRI